MVNRTLAQPSEKSVGVRDGLQTHGLRPIASGNSAYVNKVGVPEDFKRILTNEKPRHDGRGSSTEWVSLPFGFTLAFTYRQLAGA